MDMKVPLDINQLVQLLDERAAAHARSLQELGDELKAQIDEYVRNARFVNEQMNGYLPTATVFNVFELILRNHSFGDGSVAQPSPISDPEFHFYYGGDHVRVPLCTINKHIPNVPPGRYRGVVMLLPLDKPDHG